MPVLIFGSSRMLENSAWRNPCLSGRIRELDGVRGLAILLIVVFHYFVQSTNVEHPLNPSRDFQISLYHCRSMSAIRRAEPQWKEWAVLTMALGGLFYLISFSFVSSICSTSSSESPSRSSRRWAALGVVSSSSLSLPVAAGTSKTERSMYSAIA